MIGQNRDTIDWSRVDIRSTSVTENYRSFGSVNLFTCEEVHPAFRANFSSLTRAVSLCSYIIQFTLCFLREVTVSSLQVLVWQSTVNTVSCCAFPAQACHHRHYAYPRFSGKILWNASAQRTRWPLGPQLLCSGRGQMFATIFFWH